MRKPQYAWDFQALEIARNIIHLQDVLITGLAHCLQDLRAQNYEQFRIDRRAIPFVAVLIAESCDALMHLKKSQRGAKPKWFIWGEDVKYFSLEVQRCMPTIEAERRRNDWDRIKARLEEMQVQCADRQKEILEIMPEDEPLADEIYVSQKSAVEWTSLIDTLKMGTTTKDSYFLTADGFRYRKGY